MHFKKLLALLVSAALALSLLAGCGNGESAVQALLKLLDGRYPNISIEIDHDLEADLRQAIRKAEAENAGDDAAVIRAALETALGSTITFRYLGDGQQGDTTFDLVFYAGSDPDKAAQAAYSQWNLVFSNVPDDGKYDTALAMVETENGVWMLVKATVDKAGTPDKPDKDDDEPETQEPAIPENGFEVTEEGVYNVYNEEGLQAWATAAADNLTLSCTLKDDITLTEVWTPIGTSSRSPYTGTFDGGGHKILNLNVNASGQCGGLFGYIEGATVKHLTLDAPAVSTTFNGNTAWFGGIAGYMEDGTIDDCHVTGGSITSPIATGGIVGSIGETASVQNCTVSNGTQISGGIVGGIVGSNAGDMVENCEVSGCTITSQASVSGNAGGIVGSQGWSTIQNCFAHGNTILANGPSGRAGGVVGNDLVSSIIACGSTGNTVEATETSTGSAAGGVAGYTNGVTVTACFSADDTIIGPVENSRAGGVVGYATSATSKVTECYWSGSLGATGTSSNGTVTGCYKVGTDEITWSTVADAMNKAGGNQWQDKGPDSCPTLIGQ